MMKFISKIAVVGILLASVSAASECSAPVHQDETRLQRVNRLTDVQPRRSLEDIISEWNMDNVTLAAVRAPPVNWPLPILNKNWEGVHFDINSTVDRGVDYIKRAASENARLVAFPEVWFPGYPKGVINEDHPNSWLVNHAKDYIDNSIVIGDHNWNKLVQAAADNEVYLAVSISEKLKTHLYMTQLLIAPDGEILTYRHKIRPGGRERELWTDGSIMEDLVVATTPLGRIGMLSCAEHSYPEATFIMQAQTEDIHVASWPLTPAFGNYSLGYESSEVISALASVYANVGLTSLILTSVGSSTIYPGGASPMWTRNNDNDTFEDVPIIYRDVNSTAFPRTTYNANNKISWGSYQNINEGFPSYIPEDMGTFIPWHETTIKSLLAMSTE